MKKILEAKTNNDSIFWDVSTTELEYQAYVELVIWREDNQYYIDLEERDSMCSVKEFNSQNDLLREILKNQNPNAAKRFLNERFDAEDEGYLIWDLM